MAKIKYYYDTQTCKFEKLKTPTSDIIINILGFLIMCIACGAGLMFIYLKVFDSPKEVHLKKENKELLAYYNMMEKELKNTQKTLNALEQRDDQVYRLIFEADPIPNSVRQAGFGGTERYKDIMEKGLEREELIVRNMSKLDKLKKQMYVQSKSYDELIEIAKNKKEMLASIPAIQPLNDDQATRLASGYGMRIHPIYKVKMMHTGIDFASKRGKPIYATGKGKVTAVKHTYTGYGKMVEIDHGYGYKSRYGHLQKFNVKKGDEVKRGQVIGYVGNTGTSTGPHLHYEILHDKKYVNPVHYFFKDMNADQYKQVVKMASVENQHMGY